MSTIRIISEPPKPYKANTARANYWTRFKRYNGKALENLQASCNKKSPPLNKHGKREPQSGWLSYFKREGPLAVK